MRGPCGGRRERSGTQGGTKQAACGLIGVLHAGTSRHQTLIMTWSSDSGRGAVQVAGTLCEAQSNIKL